MSSHVLVHGDEEDFTLRLIQQLLGKDIHLAEELVFPSRWYGMSYTTVQPAKLARSKVLYYSSPIHVFVVDGLWTDHVRWLKHLQSQEPKAPLLLVHDWPEFSSPRFRRGANQGRITTLVGGYKKSGSFPTTEVFGNMEQSIDRIVELLGISRRLRT